jgi:hypothetical protein
MQGAQPQVLVVVNSARPDWALQLKQWAEVMVVEIFRSDRDRVILRQDGVELKMPSEAMSRCRVDPSFPRMLIIESPAPLLSLGLKTLTIDYEGEATTWKVIETTGRVWLSPKRGGIRPQHRFLDLVRLPEDRLGLIPPNTQRRR